MVLYEISKDLMLMGPQEESRNALVRLARNDIYPICARERDGTGRGSGIRFPNRLRFALDAHLPCDRLSVQNIVYCKIHLKSPVYGTCSLN